MRPVTVLATLGACLLAPGPAGGAGPLRPRPAAGPGAVEFFETHVRPVLVEKCQSCHGPARHRGGLRLDSPAGVRRGGDRGPAVVAGEPEKSLLVRAVRRLGELKMPPKEKLGDREVAALTAWVKMGAPWPAHSTAPAGSSGGEGADTHWSFRPVRKPPVPAVKDRGRVRNPLDAFVLAKLEQKGLRPSPEADRRTLIRRLSFDLLGLPPTPEEVDAFVGDARPGAYERLVDRLLASPHYGERWARHWLDVARYADTKGYVFLQERRFPYAFTYRDYVIGAFNSDKPYDRFVLEQLAADQLPLGEDKGALAAMGFLTLGRRFLNNPHDIIDDRIDVTVRGFLGLTVTCARCHDHKYDPIPTRDYYSLYGVFASSAEPADLPLIGPPEDTPARAAFEKELKARQAKVEEFLRARHAELLPRFRASVGEYLLAASKPARRGERRRDLGPNVRFALVARWRAYLARTRKAHDPAFAPWHAFAALPPAEFARRAPALAASVAANKGPSGPVNPAVARAFAGKPPASLAEVAKRYADLFADVDRRWQQALRTSRAAGKPAPAKLPEPELEALRRVLYGPGSPTDVPAAQLPRFLDRAERNRLAPLVQRVEAWKATGPGAPPRAMVLVDSPAPAEPHVFRRGNPNNPGPAVPRQFLRVLAGPHRKPFTKGSGRLELARAIASPDNPLTARVLVNRVWHWHFGRGIVATTSDFGTRGELPTHPELLDWLAATFVEEGWSVKKLHRLIVTSATYRQASDDNAGGRGVDPENRLLWRMNSRRLEFEPLRDALLAAAGTLDPRVGGRSVDITRAPYAPRRSVYGFIDRQNLPGLFRAFDLASPDASTGQRHGTTVPQQALFLMNGPFVVEQARAFARRPDVAGQKTDGARLERMYRLAYGRPPDPEELALGLEFVRSAGAESGKGAKLTPWEQYAQVLLLANEFAFVD